MTHYTKSGNRKTIGSNTVSGGLTPVANIKGRSVTNGKLAPVKVVSGGNTIKKK